MSAETEDRAYRTIVKELFALHAEVDPLLAAVARALERVAKGEAVIGAARARRILVDETGAWRRRTKACPWCLVKKPCPHVGGSAMVGASSPTQEELVG